MMSYKMDTVLYVGEQKMPRSDCTDPHADLDLRYSNMNVFFPCCASHVNAELANSLDPDKTAP